MSQSSPRGREFVPATMHRGASAEVVAFPRAMPILKTAPVEAVLAVLAVFPLLDYLGGL